MALDFFSGCLGGAAGVIVGHPLDTVKVRLQTQSPTNLKYRGTFHCLNTIVKQESVRGLYKGISSPLFGVAGVNALIFGVYGALRPYVCDAPGNNALWAHFAAGSISGAVQSVIASPMELVKTRLQISEDLPGGKKLGPVEVLKGIYRTEGGLFRGVFKGWGITLGREVPGFGVYFASYEALTRFGDGEVGTLGMMLAGGMAGVASWIVTFPIDVVKTRLQCDNRGKYNGIFDCVRKTYAAEGYHAFTRGLVSTVIRAFPTNAATFTVVTWVMRLAEGTPEDDVQSSTKYLDELLNKTCQLQEKLEDSLRLKVPQYFFSGSSLTSCSLASQCAASAQRYTNKTQVYFNFYQSLQEQLEEEEDNAESEESVGVVNNQDKKGKLSLCDRLSMHEIHKGSEKNMQGQENLIFVSSSSSGSVSRSVPLVQQEDADSDHNRNNSVRHNNHIPPLSSLSEKSRIEKHSEEENANPVNTISCHDADQKFDQESGASLMKNSSLIQGNEGFSHEAASFPAALSDTTGVGADQDQGIAERNAAQLFISNTQSLTSQHLNYLSKSLDIPTHIMEAAVAQQTHKNKQSGENNANMKVETIAQKKIKPTLTKRRDNGNVAQAWKNYCTTNKLCRCFEDHCVCYL